MRYQSADLGGLHHLFGTEIIDPVLFLGSERPCPSSRLLRPDRRKAGEKNRLMGKDFVTREIYVLRESSQTNLLSSSSHGYPQTCTCWVCVWSGDPWEVV